MRRILSLITISCVMFWTSGRSNHGQTTGATVEVIDGIELIHNTETPLYPDKTVTFVEELSLGGEEQGENIILYEPLWFDADDNANIYISELQDQVIKVFSPDGKYIKTIGAKGSGPGEFQRIESIVFTLDGKLVITDGGTRRTSFFDSGGQFLNSFQWRTGQYKFILIKSSSYVFGERAYQGIRQNSYFYVKEIDFDGKEIRDYGDFEGADALITRLRSGGTSYTSRPVSPSSKFAGDKDREWFYHCLNNKYVIEVFDSSGKLFRKIDRPYDPVPFTKKDEDKYKERFGNYRFEEVKKAVENMKMPKVKNVVSRMHVDDESNLWVRTNEVREEGDSRLNAYDIFNPEGHYYARIWTPVLPFLFKDGKMYRMDIESEIGYRSIKRYKVVWSN
ncbi:MAG: 6-bladed beta-propeller [Candidatus Aminicenantaceae bacterium]